MIVGNGENTNIWYDNWHTLGPLEDKYGDCFIYDLSLSREAKVKEIIDVEEWKWPVTNSNTLMEIKETMMNKPTRYEDKSYLVP